eukprot:comp24264_c3_seq6/m.45171 comp24264_c3_seq6/g.45171  ORF comp24264_c3_seq6/g.45171 comp24264_c3_seq6/m.45171 type:complete len:321 (-) comp24264_c3_seq6:179-1141(-)
MIPVRGLICLKYPTPPSRAGNGAPVKIPGRDLALLAKAVTTADEGLYVALELPEGYGRSEVLLGNDFVFFNQVLASYYSCMSVAALQADKPLFDAVIVLPSLLLSHTYNQADTFFSYADGDNNPLQAINKERVSASLPPLSVVSLDPTDPLEDEEVTLPTDGADAQHVYSYDCTAVGGTFDHLHSGHKVLLTVTAVMANRRVVCAVSGDPLLVNKKNREFLESEAQRIENARAFMATVRPGIDYTMVPLYDVYGPTASDPEITALAVSLETEKGGQMCVDERKLRGLGPMEVVVVKLVDGQAGEKLSSTYLRHVLSSSGK